MNTRIALVTGANKGIGLAIVRNLALKYPSSALSANGTAPLLIYLTARDATRGEAALHDLQQDAQLKQAHALKMHGGLSEVRYRTLDISKEDSIRSAGEWLKKEHPAGVDVIVNNAGIALQGFGTRDPIGARTNPIDSHVVKETLKCNYFGTLQATQTFLPQIRPGGRLVNVASMSGHLGSKYSSDIASRFRAANSVEDITALMHEFIESVQNNSHDRNGWPSAAYAVSKAGVIGMTRAMAKSLGGSKTLVNSCCPGFVDTSMTAKMRSSGKLTVDEGAAVPVQLALDDLGGQSGEFWREGRVVEW